MSGFPQDFKIRLDKNGGAIMERELETMFDTVGGLQASIVDVNNLEGAKRFLIFMVYLNDDFEGGETEFPIFGDKVKPKKGRLLMFPPFWTYLHRGNPPLKPGGYAKYLLMTYLNYTE